MYSDPEHASEAKVVSADFSSPAPLTEPESSPGNPPESIADCVLSPSQKREMDARLNRQESELARIIQRSLLPEQLLQPRGFSLSGSSVTAHEAGGDFFDVLPFGSEAAALVIADVMGSGLPAALFAAKVRTLVRTIVSWTTSPAAILTQLNQLLFEELSSVDTFVTAQIAVIDTANYQLKVGNAGHCPLLLSRGRGDVQPVAPEGMPLGVLPDTVYEELAIGMSPATRALLYTDGITEATSREGEFFGQERLAEWLAQAASYPADAMQLQQNLLAQLHKFQATLKPKDDQTFIILAPQKLEAAFAV